MARHERHSGTTRHPARERLEARASSRRGRLGAKMPRLRTARCGPRHRLQQGLAKISSLVIRAETGGAGADLILDMVAGAYVARNIDAAAMEGRIVTISLLGGARAEINMGLIRPKAADADRIGGCVRAPWRKRRSLPRRCLRASGRCSRSGRAKPVIHASVPMAQAAAAHALMESSQHIGKIVLTM